MLFSDLGCYTVAVGGRGPDAYTGETGSELPARCGEAAARPARSGGASAAPRYIALTERFVPVAGGWSRVKTADRSASFCYAALLCGITNRRRILDFVVGDGPRASAASHTALRADPPRAST